jgi:hypothetical protein
MVRFAEWDVYRADALFGHSASDRSAVSRASAGSEPNLAALCLRRKNSRGAWSTVQGPIAERQKAPISVYGVAPAGGFFALKLGQHGDR